MKKALSILIAILSLYIFYSCGIDNSPNELTVESQSGKIEITIVWPESSNGMSKVMEKIPSLTNSINITIVHATGTLTDCVDNPGTGTTTLTYFPIPVGPATVTADAFDPIGCTGVAMATAKSTAWTSNTPTVATISSTGLATASTTNTGTTIIKATYTGTTTLSDPSASTTLTVTSATLQSILVTPAAPSLPNTFKQQFTATGTFLKPDLTTFTKDMTAEPITVVANQIIPVTLVLDSTITTVDVTPNPFQVQQNSTVNFTATPKNSISQTVPTSSWTWQALNLVNVTVDPFTCTSSTCNGVRFRLINTTIPGTATITATENEFSKSGSTTGTVCTGNPPY